MARTPRDMVRNLLEELTDLEKAALLSGESTWATRAIRRLNLPSLILSDGPHGIRRQMGSGDHLGINESEQATCFPTAATVANSWDPDLAEQMGRALGKEARDLGVNMVLGPGMNMKRNPLCGRNFEYYSEDPLLAGRMAAGLVRGIQSQGVAATPKHFAVNSQETRRMASNSVIDERTLREEYLTAFEIVVKEAHPWALMTSYNEVNGQYAHENAHLLTDILRGEWGFDGMVVSDWGGSNDPVAAAQAGGSLEMPAPGLHSARAIMAALDNGTLTREALDARVSEVLELIIRLVGISPIDEGDAASPAEPDVPSAPLKIGEEARQRHHDLARRIAENSVVLLKNDDALLPLAASAKVAIIGDMAKTPRYQGAGSSLINPTELENILDQVGERTAWNVVGFSAGYERHGAPNPALRREACDLARCADVAVIFAGLDELSESEGLDRSHINLPQVQVDLIEAVCQVNTHVVVVLSAGSVVDLSWMRWPQAVVHTALSGQAGASATLDVLTGAVNPSGRLSETYPLTYQDVPNAAWYPATGRTAAYKEGPYFGYRYFQSTGTAVALPFGFGLSYSHFTYADLEVSESGAAVTVTNDSDNDGSEVVQLYVERPGAVWGPRRELKAFRKVHIAAGESTRVELAFDEFTFRHFDGVADSWKVEGGTWNIVIARNASDEGVELSASFALSADVDPDTETDTDPGADAGAADIPEPYRTGRVTEVSDEEFEALLGHELPEESDHDDVFGVNDPLRDMSQSRHVIARGVVKALNKNLQRSEKKGFPDLNTLFLLNMPLRATAKMAGGLVDMPTAEGLLAIMNGHLFKGLGQTVRRFTANYRADRRTKKELSRSRSQKDTK